MSYGVQFRCTHKSFTNQTETTFRIDILKDGYSGAITELLGYGDVFSLSYDKIDPTEPLSSPIQSGRLDFNLLVQGATENDLLTDIFESSEGQYQMALYRDDSLLWKGYVLNDLLEISQADYPFEATIRAKDFTRLEQFNFPLSSIRRKINVTIGDLLGDLGLDLGIKSYTNWTHEEISGDFLGNIYLDERQLRDFGEIGEGAEFDEDDRPLTNKQCLELILKSFGLIIRQSGGVFRIFHLSALTDTTTTEYSYDSTGAYTGSQTVNLVKSIDKDSRFILPSSQTNFNAGLKRASATLVHNTSQTEIKFDRNIVLTEGVKEQEEKTQFFNSNGKQTIRFKTSVSAEDVNSPTLFRNPISPIKIFIDGTTDYYLRADGTWTTDDTTINLELTSYERVRLTQTDTYYKFNKSFEIESETIPVSADGTLTVQLDIATHSTDTFPATSYSTPEFEIISEEDAENSVNIAYELVSDGNFSKSYDHGTIAFGDGPTPYSPSALYYGTADGERTDGGWSFVGSADKKGVQRLLLEEIMNMQSGATRNLRAELYGNFDAHDLISYESNQYMFLGGSLNGNNVWSADFLQLNFNAPTVTFQELADAKKGGGFTGASSGTVESFWSLIKQSQFFNTVFFSNYIGELSQQIDSGSTITSFNADLSAQMRVGEDFVIIDKENERPYYVNVIEDPDTGAEAYNTGEDVTVHVEEQYINTDLPIGSPVILSGGLLESYFTIDPSKLLISVQSRDEINYFGKVNENFSGQQTRTTFQVVNDGISASNPVVLKDNQEVRLRREDGESQILTVNGNQTYNSSPFTITFDSFETEFLGFGASVPQFAKYKCYIEPFNQGSSVASIDIKADSNEASITSLTSITDANGLTSSTNITQRANLTDATVVLKTDFNGNVGAFQMNANADGSTISINADQITVAGQTTFLSALQDNLTFPEGSVVIRSATAPTQRPDGEALEDGDIWIETDEGDRPYSWNGSSWTRQFTQIDGGDITTGTIDADRVFAQNISIPANGSISSTTYTSGSDGFKINADGSAEFNNVSVRSSNFSSLGSGFELTGSGIQFNESITIGSTGGIGTFQMYNPDIFTASGDGTAFYHRPAESVAFTQYRSNSLFIAHKDHDTLDGSSNEVGTQLFFGFYSGGATPTTSIQASGDGDFTFDVDGDIECTTLTETSDKYQKENIEPLGSTLDKIVQLEGKTFDMIGPSTKKKMGLLAQDVEPLFPEAVGVGHGENEEGERIEYKTLSYTQLIPALIESIKELKQEIDQLKNEQGI